MLTRLFQLHRKPLTALEFVTPLARIDPIYKEEEEQFKVKLEKLQSYFVQCYFVQCYFVQSYFVQCYFVQCYFVQCYFVLPEYHMPIYR